METIHVVSVSGGKDSAATLLLAINRVGCENVRAIFCDTGNEHEANQVAAVIQWARTSRGGAQFSLLANLVEPDACASAYGLCERSAA